MATHQFLREVAKEYSIPYDELKSRVSEVFHCGQLENLDDADDLFDGTKHFNRFVRQHDLKKGGHRHRGFLLERYQFEDS